MLNREKIELYEQELSSLFEVMTYRVTNCPLTLDGLTLYKSTIRKHRQLVFEGTMYVLRDSNDKKEWQEPFKAIVTDKRITKQGILLKISIGDYLGEKNLESISY